MRRKHIKVVYRKLGKEKAWGQAHCGDNIIEIDPRVTGKKHMELLLHETFHVLFPHLEEDDIIEKSIITTNLLWKDGYRKVDNSNNILLQDGKN